MKITLTRFDGALNINPAPPYIVNYLQFSRRSFEQGKDYTLKNKFEKNLLHVPDGQGGVTTLRGFYKQVKKLIDKNLDYSETIDHRTPIGEVDWVRVKKIGFRDYQIETIVKLLNAVQTEDGIVKAFMGWGKSIASLALYAGFHQRNTILAIPGKQLLEETYVKFKKYFPEKHVGLVQGGVCDISKDITLASYRSLRKSALEKCEFFIADEIQDSTGPDFQLTLSGITPIRVVGLTATDEGMFAQTDKVIKGVFGERLCHIEYREALDVGASVPIVVWMVNMPKTELPIEGTIQRKLTKGIRRNKTRNKLVGDIVTSIPKDWQSLTFVNYVDKHLTHLHPYMPAGTGFLHRDSDKKKLEKYALTPKEQKEVIHDYLKGKFPHLIATNAFKQGIDIPNLRVLIQASGGSSEVEITQESGRVTRILPEELRKELGVTKKTHGVVVDIYDRHDSQLQSMSEARLKIYKNLGYEVHLVDSPDQIKWDYIPHKGKANE